MRKIKEILRLSFESNLGKRQIGRSLQIAHSTVGDVLTRFSQAGLSWPLPEELDEAMLEAKLYPKEVLVSPKRPQPDFAYIYQELRRPSVTLQLLWNEYKQLYPEGYQYSQFCELYRQWSGKLTISMRQIHRAGEKMFVDWAGQTVPIIDKTTGEVHQSSIFVAVLGASSYTFACAFLDFALKSWTTAHCLAFEYFGGVTEIVVPDNTKTAVLRPCRYEPILNPAYQDLAAFYGTAIIPARVRKPKDKPKAELGVLLVQRWILAALRNYRFFSIDELNRKIAELLITLNRRPFQKLDGSRYSLFESIDRPALKALPNERYQFAEWKKARVNVDCHVEFESCFYSVSYQLVRQEVELRVTANIVEVFHKGRRVASHRRGSKKGAYSTITEHLPHAHQQYREWGPERIVGWAGTIGPNTSKLVAAILASKIHPEQGYRACFGVMRLGKLYPVERLEAASLRALNCNAVSYQSLKSILEKGLDQQPLDVLPQAPPIIHANVRGPEYFNSKGVLH
jgi:transposase